MSSRLTDIKASVAKFKCERSGFDYPVEELVEEEETGLIVHKRFVDNRSFSKTKSDSPREESNHHFTT
jgi:hypothetical protein